MDNDRNDVSPIGNLPWQRCEERYCTALGPYTERRMLSDDRSSIALVGWCDSCKRCVCTQCALPVQVQPAGPNVLTCRKCGLPLGTGSEELRIDAISPDCASGEMRSKENRDRIAKVPPTVWGEIVLELARRGIIPTTRMRAAHEAREQENFDRAKALLEEERDACLRAGYRPGEGRCEHELGVVLLLSKRPTEALKCLDRAESILRECGNEKLLLQCLAMKSSAQKETDADSSARLKVLTEAIDLHEKARDRGMTQFKQALELLRQERIQVLLSSNNLENALQDIRQLPEAIRILRGMAEAQNDANKQSNRLPRFSLKADWDEEALDSLRETQDVWGCPNGCAIQGTMGFIGMPKGSPGARIPCLLCGSKFVLLNDYCRLAAIVPDWPEPGLLEPQYLPAVRPDSIELLNLSLVLRNAGSIEHAVTVQERIIAEWEHELGSASPEFAHAICLLGRILQDRNEHKEALKLFRRAVEVSEAREDDDSGLLPSNLNNAGLSLACMREYQEAEELLRRAVHVAQGFANPCYWLAKLYQRRNAPGDEEKEQQAWRDYLGADPANDQRRSEAQERLAEIEAGSNETDGSRQHETDDSGPSEAPVLTLPEDVVKESGYPVEAFTFVLGGLAFAQRRFEEEFAAQQQSREGPTHITAQYLCWALRDLAVQKYGADSVSVLQRWNIQTTEDFGKVVYSLVIAGLMSATEQDSASDFVDVYDFADAFA